MFDEIEEYIVKNFLNNLSVQCECLTILNYDKISILILNKNLNWNDIQDKLNKLLLKKNFECTFKMALIILSNELKGFYSKLQDYFINTLSNEIQTQFILSINIQKNDSNIYSRIIGQMNIKMGGINFYIDFEGILEKKNNYWVLGLEERQIEDNIYYCLTSTNNSHLSEIITSFVVGIKSVNDSKDPKFIPNAICQLIEKALRKYKIKNKILPNYVSLYRKNRNIN